MATLVQRLSLMSVQCPWCGAAVGQECTDQSRRRTISTLDGHAHDARWMLALNLPAPVAKPRVLQVAR